MPKKLILKLSPDATILRVAFSLSWLPIRCVFSALAETSSRFLSMVRMRRALFIRLSGACSLLSIRGKTRCRSCSWLASRAASLYYQSCSYRAARARHPERTWSPGTPRKNGCGTRETGCIKRRIGIAGIRSLGRLEGREPEYPVAVGFRDVLPDPPGPIQIALCSSGDSKHREWNHV